MSNLESGFMLSGWSSHDWSVAVPDPTTISLTKRAYS